MLAHPVVIAVVAVFNLVCTGKYSDFFSSEPKVDEPFEIILRVDLKRRIFCEADCKITEHIANVGSGLIIFQDDNDANRDGGTDQFRRQVDRQTGEFTQTFFAGGGSNYKSFYKGKCEKAPFTGLYSLGSTKF